MAIAFVASSGVQGASGTFTTPSMDTTGANFLVATISEQNAAGVVLTDSKGNTWTQLTERSATTPSQAIWYAKNATVGTGHTFTLTGGAFNSIVVLAFSGVDTTSPFDQQNGTGGLFTSTMQAGSVTPGVDNELIISGEAFDNAVTPTIDSGMTLDTTHGTVGGTYYGISMAYKIQTTAAAIDPTWSFGGGLTPIDASNATFQAAAAVPGASNTPRLDARMFNFWQRGQKWYHFWMDTPYGLGWLEDDWMNQGVFAALMAELY